MGRTRCEVESVGVALGTTGEPVAALGAIGMHQREARRITRASGRSPGHRWPRRAWGSMPNTSCHIPAAAQASSYCSRSGSMKTRRGVRWPKGGTPPVGIRTLSAVERSDERLCLHARLAEDPAHRAALDFTMERHHTTDGPATQHHVATPLPHDDEAKSLQRTNSLSSGDVRKLRQRRRCGTW